MSTSVAPKPDVMQSTPDVMETPPDVTLAVLQASPATAIALLAKPRPRSAPAATAVPAHAGSSAPGVGQSAFALAAWHGLFWLVVANGIGVIVAAMLLWPGLNNVFGEWTYGTWLPVHMNLQLYGWCSLPLVGFLVHVYGAHGGRSGRWVSPVLALWSLALGVGAVSWLEGHSSGKLFLDWTGFPRIFFPLALFALWALLVYALWERWTDEENRSRLSRVLRVGCLIVLAVVPCLLYIAADPSIYPPINPDTGGPTGASQLESTLVIVAILLLLPLGLIRGASPRKHRASLGKDRVSLRSHRTRLLAWSIFTAEVLLCLGLGRADVSHHRPTQWISLGSLLLWIPLLPAYYAGFAWHPSTRMWRMAMLAWWAVLVPTGWALFLPGVLDRAKFTDGLVGHSLLAMGGFVSSLLIFVMAQLLQDSGAIFNGRCAFVLWHGSVGLYVADMFAAGLREGSDPAFSILPGTLRNGMYAARLVLGIFMLAASVDWLYWASRLLLQKQTQTLVRGEA